MKRNLTLTLALVLGGCAGGPQHEVKMDPRIMAEMDSAAQRTPAPTPEAVSQSLLPPLKTEIPRPAAQALEPRFDLAVSGALARDVFNSIVSGTRYSMLIHPDVAGRISVNLKDVTVREALDSIREVYGFEHKIEGTRIYVLPAGLQTRVFHVNYLIGTRAGRSDVRVSAGAIAVQPAGTPGGASLPGTGTTGAAGAPQASGMTALGAAALSGTTNDATRVATVSQSDFWNELERALRTLLGAGEGKSVVVSPQSGVIVVRAMPREIRSVEEYLAAMRLSVERQVMIEAKIISVALNDAFQTGINWAAFPSPQGRPGHVAAGVLGPNTTLGTTGAISGTAPIVMTASPATGAVATGGVAAGGAIGPAAGSAGAGMFGIALQSRNFSALLQFLEAQGSAQVLSSPRVATMNNQKAVLKVGTDQFFVTTIDSTPISSAAGVTTGVQLRPTFNSFFSGVSLDITPQIDADGNILLHIHPLVSTVSDGTKQFNFGTGIGAVDVPLARSDISETDTIVRVQDGNIVALGGLMRVEQSDNSAGVPGLQGLPLIGGLFANRSRAAVKSELVILLKPTIIRDERDWQQDVERTRERLRANETPAKPAAGPR